MLLLIQIRLIKRNKKYYPNSELGCSHKLPLHKKGCRGLKTFNHQSTSSYLAYF